MSLWLPRGFDTLIYCLMNVLERGFLRKNTRLHIGLLRFRKSHSRIYLLRVLTPYLYKSFW